ncbi:MAG: HAMP domain-containing sensor histidine kinase, partial [Myxococcota bacterium]
MGQAEEVTELGPRIAQEVAAIALAAGLTAVASWLFHGRVGADFVITGMVAAAIVNAIIDGVTVRLRRRNAALQQEVLHRAAEAQAVRAAAGIAHELKNPLSAVVGNLELAQELLDAERTPATDAELASAVTGALDAARHLGSLIQDLRPLGAGRPTPQSVEPRSVTLADAAAAAIRMTRAQVEPVGRVALAEGELPPLSIDRSQLVQILLNLILNAAHASRPGIDNVIGIAGTAVGSEVELVVTDRGRGMSPAVLARVFEPGFTTRPE